MWGWVSSNKNMGHIISLKMYLYITCMYVRMYAPMHLGTYASTYLPTCLPMCLSIYLSTYLPIYLSTYLPIYLSFYLSIYLCMHIFSLITWSKYLQIAFPLFHVETPTSWRGGARSGAAPQASLGWFRNPARKPVDMVNTCKYPIPYDGFYICQVVVWDFFHLQYQSSIGANFQQTVGRNNLFITIRQAGKSSNALRMPDTNHLLNQMFGQINPWQWISTPRGSLQERVDVIHEPYTINQK